MRLPETIGTIPDGDLSAWAGEHGLDHTPEGLLPPVTKELRRGLGVGEHRAILGHADAFTLQRAVRRPERSSHELCTGVLPGGLRGTLAHHRHLVDYTDTDGATHWRADTTTVVLAQLPENVRGVAELTVSRVDVKALATLDFSGGRASSDPRATMAPQETTREERDGLTYTLKPAEDAEALDLIASAATRAAFAAAPEGAHAEYERGHLCVAAPGQVISPAHLDALCHAASALADGIRAVAARHPEVDPASALPAPPRTRRSVWIDAGVATVDWPHPPASAAEARAAYAQVTAPRARRVGVLVGLLAFAIGIVFAAGALAVGLALDLVWGGVVTAVFALWVTFKLVRGSIRAGGEVRDDEVAARAWPWGMEAFVRGHAAARGLTLEDADELRRRLRTVLPGRPMKAMHGELAPGVPGHLAIWVDPVVPGPARTFLVAVVPPPADGRAPAVEPPFWAEVQPGHLLVAMEVAEADRSTVKLDELARVAAAHAGR
jgi:hypothetical protein